MRPYAMHLHNDPKVQQGIFAFLAAEAVGIAAYASRIDLTGTAAALVGVAMVIAGGYIGVVNLLRGARRKWEVEDKDSLTKHIGDLTESVSRERQSLHDLRNEANNRELTVANWHLESQKENKELRQQLGEVTKQLLDVTNQLTQANELNMRLADEIVRTRVHTLIHAEVVEQKVAQIASKVEQTAHAIEAATSGAHPAVMIPPDVRPEPREAPAAGPEKEASP